MTRFHIVGAGLAGLSAAITAVRHGHGVALYDAAPQAGGRCRSYHDERLGCVIDNGGHVVMSANEAALDYLDFIGGRPHMVEVAPAEYPFFDLLGGVAWSVRPGAGRAPWWLFARSRRPPGMTLRSAWRTLSLLRAGPDDTIAQHIPLHDRARETFWEPLVVAAMNAPLEQAAARPLAEVMRRTFLRGEAACRPMVARAGLSRAFVDPALDRLDASGGAFLADRRLQRLEIADGRVAMLVFSEAQVEIGADDVVILAVTPTVAASLVPGLVVPEGSNAIVNAHFRLKTRAVLPGGKPLVGLYGGMAQWLIAHDDIVSATISAADAVVDKSIEELATLLWKDVATAIQADPENPAPYRLIKEKRATFAQTPANQKRRPGPRSTLANLFLAGDWTDTGLPATIESAIASGRAAILAATGPG